MILAVDGGGTKTVAIIIDENSLKLIGLGISGPSNVRSVSAMTSRKNILKAIGNAEKMAGMVKIDRSIYGIAGYGDSTLFTSELDSIIESIDKLSPSNPIITNDGEAAAYLITLGGDGIVSATGTGSVGAYIKNGEMHRVGGWSYLTNDSASGYWIARKGIQMAEKSSDGLIGPTQLINRLEDVFKLSLRDLVANLEDRFNKRIMASLAIIVDDCSNNGDEISAYVLKLAFNEIKLMLDGMQRQFENKVPIGSVGGVMQSKTVRKLLQDEYNDIEIFYGYHVAIGNAMRLLNIRDIEVRNSFVSQLDSKIKLISKTERDLLFLK
ncbi:MAG: BadF/BadG/BcrA/BcrD ATPase family protein [Ferroplasma sp.]